MKQKPVYTWYVEPLRAHTNEVIARELGDDIFLERNVRCEDGILRTLWRCDYAFVARLQQSKQSLQIEFRVFNKRGKHGAVRLWHFTRSRKAAATTRRKLDIIRKRRAS
ncbi:MAG: hypothetical protein AAB417_02210 [Patescibacteria group bacterium]